MFLSGRLYDDGVIDPRDTRTVLGLCLSVIENAPPVPVRAVRAASASSGCDAPMRCRHADASSSPTGARSRAGLPHLPRLGIATVAVYSDADAGLPYVREADVAVRLPGNAPADTYLRGDLLVEAALAAGADAVHPGYGFLSENADFARAVIDAGLTWIGPPPEAIEAMGVQDRGQAADGGGRGAGARAAPTRPTEADLPVLVKAAAGGGGRGMRVVRELADLEGEFAAARAEAASAFGDGEVSSSSPTSRAAGTSRCRCWPTPRHGLVLGERDCSIQRRHQKVIEETPAPALSADTRGATARGGGDGRRAAIGYAGAGTVEFLVAPRTGASTSWR